MLIQLFFLISVSLFSKRYGNSSGACTMSNPCSYSRVETLSKENDTIILTGFQAISFNHIIELKRLIEYSINNGVSIYGNNMTIDGKYYNNSECLFIFDQIRPITLSNFSFCNFNMPIFMIRNSAQTNLSYLSFFDCQINYQFSLITITGKSVFFSNCQFLRNVIHESCLISIHSSNVQFHSSIFDNNFISSGPLDSMIFIINSSLTLNDSILIRNHMSRSPLFYSDICSRIFLFSSNFTSNLMTEMFFMESFSIISGKNVIFNDNFGILFYSDSDYELKLKNVNFLENYSLNMSLINSKNSQIILHNSYFSLNHGKSIIHSEQSNITLKINTFINNSGTQWIIDLNNHSMITIENVRFIGNMPHLSLISNENSTLFVNAVSFKNSCSYCLSLINSQSFINNTLFKHTNSPNSVSILIDNSKCTIMHSTFYDETYTGSIKIIQNYLVSEKYIVLKKNNFKTQPKFAIQSFLREICEDCVYEKSFLNKKSNQDSHSSLYLLNILICILIFLNRQIIFSKFSNRKKNDHMFE